MIPLKTKVTLLLLPIVALPMVVVGAYLYNWQANRFIAEIHSQLQEELRQGSERFDDRITIAKGNTGLIAQSHLVLQYLDQSDEEQRFYLYYRPILELFRSYQRIFPEYQSIQLLDHDGTELIRLDQQHSQLPPVPMAEIIQALQHENRRDRIMVLPPELNQSSPRLLILRGMTTRTFTQWNTDTPFETSGYVAVIARLDDLITAAMRVRIGATGSLLVTDSQGTPYLYAKSRMTVRPVVLERAVNMDASVSALDVDGNRFLSGHIGLLPNLQIIGLWPQIDLQDTAIELAREISWLTLLFTTIIAVLILLVVNSQLIKPITQLTRFTRALNRSRMDVEEHEHVSYRQTLSRQDEFGELAKAFRELDTSLRASNLQLSYIAYHDSLTGLANRHTFSVFLQKTISAAQRHDYKVALLYIDIDGFKEVNDTRGHDAGDLVLKDIAERLNGVLREEDLVADFATYSQHVASTKISRIGGDEFAIVVNHLQQSEHVAGIAERILDVMAPPFQLENDQFQLGASIGISIYPDNGNDAKALLKCADIAMYQSKNRGKNRFEFYDRSIDEQAIRHYNLLQDLRQAIQSQRLELFYQPQIHTSTGAATGFEALLRWHHPDEGYIPPNEFIPLAEQAGLIGEIGEYVIKEACRQYREWQDLGIAPGRIAVNVSPFQFSHSGKVSAFISSTLDEYRLPGHVLELEVTETAIMQSSRIELSQLEQLKTLGLSISMDDFGTGYSSLAALRDLPIDQLKIDKSFVDRIEEDVQGQGIIKAILALSRELEIEVVAEGVESESQYLFLRQNQCQLIQGYYFSKPMNADDTLRYLKQSREQAGA